MLRDQTGLFSDLPWGGLSSNFKHMSDDERRIMLETVAATIDVTIFNFLCMLDGITSTTTPNSQLELKLIQRETVAVVNEWSDGVSLHDFYTEMFNPFSVQNVQ
jgi:hypothetical protein